MAVANLTTDGVLAALDKFDDLGRKGFLDSTGFRPANSYFLEHRSRLYDSKAIVGYAHGASTGTPLRPNDFSGGEQTVARWLTDLGFSVRYLPHRDWTRDELILACELLEANGWRQADANDEQAKSLSALLQSPRIHPVGTRHPDFRNPAGVARKTLNIAACHPDYRGARSNGSHLDKEVLDD